MTVAQKNVIEEVINAVEDEFEGFAESKEELEDFVSTVSEELMEEHDVDLDEDDIMREVLKHVTFPREMETICHQCGDPDCSGC